MTTENLSDADVLIIRCALQERADSLVAPGLKAETAELLRRFQAWDAKGRPTSNATLKWNTTDIGSAEL